MSKKIICEIKVFTLKEEIFAGINFRDFFSGHFAGINIREFGFTEDFAGIKARGGGPGSKKQVWLISKSNLS